MYDNNKDAVTIEQAEQVNRDLRTLVRAWKGVADAARCIAEGAQDARKRQLDAARQLIG